VSSLRVYTAEESDLLRLVQRRGDVSRLGARVLQRQRQIHKGGEVARGRGRGRQRQRQTK